MSLERAPANALRTGMDSGRAVALRILQHPMAADILERYGPPIRDRVPEELAPDQFTVTDLGLAVGTWPELTGWLRPEGVPALLPGDPLPNFPVYVDNADPRLTAGPWCAGWPGLPAKNREELHDFVGALRSLVVAEARALGEAGVPVDPGSPLDLSLLIQLALLDRGGTPEDVVSELNLLPPYALSGDGRDLRNVRDGTNEQVERAAVTVRRWWRSQHEDDQTEVLRVRGGRPGGSRTAGSDTSLLYEHLPAVLARCPHVNAKKLIRQWQQNVAGSAGVALRELMGKRVGDRPPAERTLQRALKNIRQ
jgi:hypothetical protein